MKRVGRRSEGGSGASRTEFPAGSKIFTKTVAFVFSGVVWFLRAEALCLGFEQKTASHAMKPKTRICAAAFLAFAAIFSASGATYYVSTTGSADAKGTEADPYDIATGFGKASGGSKHEIVIMPGTYNLTATLAARGGGSVVRGSTGKPEDVTIDAGGKFPVMRLAHDILVHSLTIQGGVTNPATSGNNGVLASAVRLGADSWDGSSVVSNCVIRGNNNPDSSSKFTLGAVVMYHNSRLLDCTIEDNTAKYACAGVNVAESGAEIRGCVFRNNRAENGNTNTHGGAIVMGTSDVSVVVEDCVFEGNYARSAGGAFLARASNASATIRRCTFTGNAAGYGAAVSTFANDDVVLEDCTFENNTATANGGAIRLYGGSVVKAAGCTFTGNRGVRGGAVVVTGSSRLVTDGCTFSGNSATDTDDPVNNGKKTVGGGAVACDFLAEADGTWGGVWASNTVFTANSAKSYGGALSNTGGYPIVGELVNCKFTGNSAVTYGGAVFLCESNDETYADRGSAAPFLIRQTLFAGNSVIDKRTAGTAEKGDVANGGALYFVSYQNPAIDSCTIVGNSATSPAENQGKGGAMYHKWGGTVVNTIIVNNTDSLNGGALTTDSMLNAAAYSHDCAYPAADTLFTAANGNVIGEPAFVDAENGDYRLSDKDAVCRNKGLYEDWMSGAKDLAGIDRIYGSGVDIGAYEVYVPAAFTIVVR